MRDRRQSQFRWMERQKNCLVNLVVHSCKVCAQLTQLKLIVLDCRIFGTNFSISHVIGA